MRWAGAARKEEGTQEEGTQKEGTQEEGTRWRAGSAAVVVGLAMVVVVPLATAASAAPDECEWKDTAARLVQAVEAAAADGTDKQAVGVLARLRALGLDRATCAGAAPDTAQAAPATGTAQTPGQLLDLSDWYLTLPTGSAGSPDTVQQGSLAAYTSPYFHLDDARQGIVFTADAGGVTTKNSSYPRSELREMTPAGEQASWSNTTGTHTLAVRQAVTALPTAKPHVVTAQIHDTKSDVIEVRLEGEKLIAQYDDGRTDVTIDPAYVLGTPYDLSITAADGHVSVTYNGVQKLDVPLSGSGWYFKTGSYLQSNTEKGDAPDAVGSVVLYALSLTHTD